jgi:two-component system chemotaxis response regulator CheB
LIVRLASEPIAKGVAAMAVEPVNSPDVAELGTENLEVAHVTHPPSALTCPDCGGALWEVQNERVLRFRCHLGHGFTGESLDEHQLKNVENAMWTAMRTLEESASLRRRLAARTRSGKMEALAMHYEEQAKSSEARAAVIRAVLMNEEVTAEVTGIRPSPKARERAGDKRDTRPGSNGNGGGGGAGLSRRRSTAKRSSSGRRTVNAGKSKRLKSAT